MMNTVIALITVIIKATTDTIFSAPFKCDQRARRDVTSNFIFCNLTAQCSLHHTRMWLHFTCLNRIFRRKRFTGCWLPRTPWDFDFFVAIFFIVPCKKSKLALDLDVSLNHIFLKHSKCIEHFHRKCFKNFVTLIFHTLYVASPWTANIFCLVIQFWNPDMLHTVAVYVETSRTEGSLLQVASTSTATIPSSSATTPITTPAVVWDLLNDFLGDRLQVQFPLLLALLARVVVRVRLQSYPLLCSVHYRIVAEHVTQRSLQHRRLCHSSQCVCRSIDLPASTF